MRRSKGQKWAPAALLGPAITAACLAVAGAAQACPSSYNSAKKQAQERAQIEQTAAALASTDCPYAKRGGSAGSMSTPTKAAFAAVPAALAAFALGWRSAGRRRRGIRTSEEVSK